MDLRIGSSPFARTSIVVGARRLQVLTPIFAPVAVLFAILTYGYPSIVVLIGVRLCVMMLGRLYGQQLLFLWTNAYLVVLSLSGSYLPVVVALRFILMPSVCSCYLFGDRVAVLCTAITRLLVIASGTSIDPTAFRYIVA